MVVADRSFAALAFLDAVASYVTVVTRLRLDAALYAPAPPRSAHQVGRPRCKGARLPALQHHLDDPDTPWQPLTLPRWYDRKRRTVGSIPKPLSGITPACRPCRFDGC